MYTELYTVIHVQCTHITIKKPIIFLQAVTNFVMYKFGSLKQAEWQTMYDLAKMFLYCFNHWKLETPSIHARSSPTDDQRAYKENHARYA